MKVQQEELFATIRSAFYNSDASNLLVIFFLEFRDAMQLDQI